MKYRDLPIFLMLTMQLSESTFKVTISIWSVFRWWTCH